MYKYLLISFLGLSLAQCGARSGDTGMTGTGSPGRGDTVTTGTAAPGGTSGGGTTNVPGKVQPDLDAAEEQPTEDYQDQQISEAVRKQIADTGMLPSNFVVSTEQGVVTLRGTVSSEETRTQVVEMAKRVSGVKDVRSELQVQKQ